MAKKVYVQLTVILVINVEDSIDIDEVLSDMDYNFTSQTDNAIIEGTEIVEQEITAIK